MLKKKIFKVLLISVVVILCFSTVASATNAITNTKTTRIAKVPTKIYDGERFSCVGGATTDNDKHSMFVLKSSDTENHATLYYYPDLTDATSRSTYYTYRVPGAGHANGMTIDSNSIYITCWSNIAGENTGDNKIIAISLDTIDTLPQTKLGYVLQEHHYNVINAKSKTISSNGSISYSNYGSEIRTITKYTGDGIFLIRSNINAGNDFAYTVARLETYNGSTILSVSSDPADTFIVKNTLSATVYHGQDICYSPYTGLLIPVWYGHKVNGVPTDYCKNEIMWVNIVDGSYSTKTIDNVSYKYYTPTNIVVDHTNTIGYGVQKYTKFEIESIAITKNKRMLLACNIEFTTEFETEYEERNDGVAVGGDGVYRLTYDTGGNILL